MSAVTYDGVEKRFGDVVALHALDLHVADGTFLVLLGPSGCGKTTALRVLAGLEQPSGGRVLLGDRDVTRLPPRDRDVAMVFQSYALYPHMSVAKNIGYPLRIRKVPSAERERAVREVAETLEVAHLLQRRPGQLSGGQRQRIALARAIVRQPACFLMDEPLSNLDAQLRLSMRGEIKRLQHRLGTTTLYVTHDQAEALTMADVIAVMKDGVLQQLAGPGEIYERPANRFVATFVGSPPMNVLPLALDGDRRALVVAGTRLSIGESRYAACSSAGAIEFGVRPEDLRLAEPGREGIVSGEVHLVEPMGNETLIGVSVGGERLTVRVPHTWDGEVGSVTGVALDPETTSQFDAEGRTVVHRADRQNRGERAGAEPGARSS